MEKEHPDRQVERGMYIQLHWILLLVRIVLAIVMIYYGWPKISDLTSNANDFVQMGFKPGIFWGTLIAVIEFFGGVAIFVGLYAELAAALFVFQMIVGTFWKLKIGLGHHENFDALLAQARTMLAALRTGADTTRASIDALLKRIDDLLQRLSNDGAASRTAA